MMEDVLTLEHLRHALKVLNHDEPLMMRITIDGEVEWAERGWKQGYIDGQCCDYLKGANCPTYKGIPIMLTDYLMV